MRRQVFLVCLLLALAGSAAVAQAGAFTLPDGQFLGQFGVKYFNSFQFYDDEGELTRSRADQYYGKTEIERHEDESANLDYRDIAGFTMLRFGITDNWEFGLFAPVRYQSLDADFEVTESWALGDVALDSTFKILGGSRAALALAGRVKIPWFYNADAELPAGDGQVDIDAKLLAAARFSFFTFALDGGYRYRFSEPADVWLYGGELSFAYSIVFGAVRVDGFASARNAEEDAEWRDYYHAPDYALVRINSELGVFFTEHLGLSFTAMTPVYGRNAAYGVTYVLSFLYTY